MKMSISSDINFFDALLILANLMFSLIIPFKPNVRKEFEHDFIAAPNADANRIPLNFRGAKKVMVDDGCMIVKKSVVGD